MAIMRDEHISLPKRYGEEEQKDTTEERNPRGGQLMQRYKSASGTQRGGHILVTYINSTILSL